MQNYQTYYRSGKPSAQPVFYILNATEATRKICSVVMYCRGWLMLEGLCVSVFSTWRSEVTYRPSSLELDNWLKNTDTVWILAGRLLSPSGHSNTLRSVCLFYSQINHQPVIFLHCKLIGILSPNEHNIQPTEPKKDVFWHLANCINN